MPRRFVERCEAISIRGNVRSHIFGSLLVDRLNPFDARLAELKVASGHPTERDSRYDWPRIGFTDKEEVTAIVFELKAFLGVGS